MRIDLLLNAELLLQIFKHIEHERLENNWKTAMLNKETPTTSQRFRKQQKIQQAIDNLLAHCGLGSREEAANPNQVPGLKII